MWLNVDNKTFEPHIFQMLKRTFEIVTFRKCNILCVAFSLPWNQQTSLGFFYELVFSLYAMGYYLFTSGVELVLFISVCLHDLAFYKMFDFIMIEFDRDDNKPKQRQILSQLIRLHVSGKKYFNWFWLFIFFPFISSLWWHHTKKCSVMMEADILDVTFISVGFCKHQACLVRIFWRGCFRRCFFWCATFSNLIWYLK